MKRAARWLLWTALSCAALPTQQTAHACSVTSCNTGLTLPMDGGGMPANALPLLWRKPGPRGGAFDYQLELLARSSEGVSAALEFELVERGDVTYIQPREALRPGSELTLSYTRPSCGRDPEARMSASIVVGEPAPKPVRLGKLTAREHRGLLTVASIAGDCARETWAGYADLSVELSDDARPYQDVLRYELRVDGDAPSIFYDSLYAANFEERLWTSALGEGRDRVFVACESDVRLALALRDGRHAPALAPGKHRVRMVGILPDDSTIESDELEVELECVEQPPSAAAESPRPTPAGAPAAGSGGGCSTVRPGRRGVPTGLHWLALLWAANQRRRRVRAPLHERSTP